MPSDFVALSIDCVVVFAADNVAFFVAKLHFAVEVVDY